MRHGYGVYQFKSGYRYQGCYKYGLRNGKGVMYYMNNAKYEGMYISQWIGMFNKLRDS